MLGLSGAALLALVVLAALGAAGRGARIVPLGVAAAAALLGIAALGAIAQGGAPVVTLPIGPPSLSLHVALDPLSAWFLLLLALVALPAGLAAAAGAGLSRPLEAAALPLFVAAMAVTLLAADLFTLLLGFEAMSLASFALVAARHPMGQGRRAARLYIAFAALSGLALLGAVALLGGRDFAALRAAPPEGWRAALAFALLLLGAGSKAGLIPFHAWLPLAHPAAATPVSALMSGAMVKVALYVIARGALDLLGPGTPATFGAPLVALGAATALAGALRANLEADTKAVLACSTLENVGLIALALGLALLFRAADLLPLAALALSAALLHAMAHALFKTLLFLGAGAVADGAGSRDLDRLGGLIHRMPRVAILTLLGAATAAALPPLAGFAGEWLLLQALLQGWRVAELSAQFLIVAALAATGMAVALGLAAMLRLWGLAFLGRPRSLRAAGARDVDELMLTALAFPAALTLLLGLFAAPALTLAGGAVALLLGTGPGVPAAGLALSSGETGAAYAPLAVLALLALPLTALALAFARLGAPAVRRGPAWDCGFQPPPATQPFGDPRTQPSAAGFAEPLRRSLGGLVLARREAERPAAPGSAAPARLETAAHDRSFPWLLWPLTRLRRRAGHAAEQLRNLPLRATLVLAFGTLLGLLALLASLERA
jgi:formate hydrogenlyase subunit 3/multisubunit Na+/H+ antiporter MnhD subunit